MAGGSEKAGTEDKQTCGQKCSSGCSSFATFMWNSERSEFMGRTGSSWAKIGFFYLIFYGFLAGFFAGMLVVFMSTLNKPEEGGPKLTQFIENQPGLTRLDSKDNRLPEEYEFNDTNIIESYSNFTNAFLESYNTSDHSGSLCELNSKTGMASGKACVFDRSLLSDCDGITDTSYGLKTRKPCIFIRINKIYNWVPESDTGYLELSCDEGTVYPAGGFLIGGFPFRGQKGYQSPVVAVQVDTTSGSVDVKCTLKGKNIKVSSSFKTQRSYGKIMLQKISSKA